MVAVPSIIQPKRPAAQHYGWVRLPPPPQWATLGFAGEAWTHLTSGLTVISAVEVAKDADGIDRGPEYHLSISYRASDGSTQRCSSNEANEVLRQFDLDGAEEDNHVPHGMVRNFWRPVADHLVGMECACKAQESAIRENKGDYVWRPAE